MQGQQKEHKLSTLFSQNQWLSRQSLVFAILSPPSHAVRHLAMTQEILSAVHDQPVVITSAEIVR